MGLPFVSRILHPSCPPIPGFTDKAERQSRLAQWQETGTRMCTVVADAQRKGTRAKGSCTGCAIDRQSRGISGRFPESELQLSWSNLLIFLFLFFVFDYLLIKCTLLSYNLHEIEVLVDCVCACTHVWSMCVQVHVSFSTCASGGQRSFRCHCSGMLPIVF